MEVIGFVHCVLSSKRKGMKDATAFLKSISLSSTQKPSVGVFQLPPSPSDTDQVCVFVCGGVYVRAVLSFHWKPLSTTD